MNGGEIKRREITSEARLKQLADEPAEPFKNKAIKRKCDRAAIKVAIASALEKEIETKTLVYFDQIGTYEKHYLALFHYYKAETWYVVESSIDCDNIIIYIMPDERTAKQYIHNHSWRKVTGQYEYERVTHELKDSLKRQLVSEITAYLPE